MAPSCERAPVPPPAERARALAGRAGAAALVPGTDELLRVVPTLHHVPAGGAATLQLAGDHPLVAQARSAPVPAMLELTDTAPVAVREPVRGLVWISGWVRVLTDRTARRAALRIAAEAPDERLLDVGHRDVLLRLEPASVVLADAEGSVALAPADLAAAPADPVAAVGDRWLRHLVAAHPGLVADLAAHLPPALRRGATAVVPLAVDRLGIRLRVEGPRGDHDARLAFSRPVACPHALGEEVRRLAAGAPDGGDRTGPGRAGLSRERPSSPASRRREHPARRRPAADA